MRADVFHRELLHGRRYGFGTKGADFQRRHVVTRHFLCAGWVGHHCFQERGARLKQRDVIALDDGGKAARMGNSGEPSAITVDMPNASGAAIR